MKIIILALLIHLGNGVPKTDNGTASANQKSPVKVDNAAQVVQKNPVGENLNQTELEQRIETEIDGYHEIKKRIQFLESHLKEHADFNLIKTEDLVDAASTLQTLKKTIIEPLETNLLAVRSQIAKEGHQLTPKELHLVKSVLENADAFLLNSEDRLNNLELIENDWDVLEESEKIRQASEGVNIPVMLPKMDSKGRITAKTSEESVLRSKKLQKVQELILKREQIKQALSEKASAINFKELKLKLDLEAKEDTEPGFGKKHIKEELEAAAEKSHEYLDNVAHHGESIMKHPAEVASTCWILAISLAGVSACLVFVMLLKLCARQKQKQQWKRNMLKTQATPKRERDTTGTYCELDEVKHEDKVSALSLTNLSAQPWVDNNWGDWNEDMKHKLK